MNDRLPVGVLLLCRQPIKNDDMTPLSQILSVVCWALTRWPKSSRTYEIVAMRTWIQSLRCIYYALKEDKPTFVFFFLFFFKQGRSNSGNPRKPRVIILVWSDCTLWCPDLAGDGDLLPEIRRKIALGWAAFGKMDNIMRSRKANMKIKRKVHDGNILPVMTYGCESLALINAMRNLRLHSENWNA